MTFATLSHSDYARDIGASGTYENKVLYGMCLDECGHTCPQINSGKILAIGRIYSASPERGVAPLYTPSDSFVASLGRALADSDLDTYLSAFSERENISDSDILLRVVDTHALLVSILFSATEAWLGHNSGNESRKARYSRSFASKYLHFHRPNAFPIMDSIATKGLRKCGFRVSEQNFPNFCRSIASYKTERELEELSLRETDTRLLALGRKY